MLNEYSMVPLEMSLMRKEMSAKSVIIYARPIILDHIFHMFRDESPTTVDHLTLVLTQSGKQNFFVGVNRELLGSTNIMFDLPFLPHFPPKKSFFAGVL